jgi:NAD(P)-dependent dehydrogenase (short-subunit alcohol dehydrogenase family)
MKHRNIFITGAASGIGRLTALRFAREGWRIGAFDIDTAGLDTLQAELGEDSCLIARLDVTDRDAFAAAIDRFGAWSGGSMDVLFNNAGILQQGRFEAIPLDSHLRTIDVNVRGVVIGTYLALPLLKATPDACILSMCSASAVYGTPDHSVYSATKFAVRALTEALSLELAAAGIRVVDLMPSFVATPMVLDQTNPSPMVARMGIAHQPEEIAEWAWRAVHGRRIHWMALQLRLTDILASMFPGIVRFAMNNFSKSQVSRGVRVS